jgi:hypothetical protein
MNSLFSRTNFPVLRGTFPVLRRTGNRLQGIGIAAKIDVRTRPKAPNGLKSKKFPVIFPVPRESRGGPFTRNLREEGENSDLS